MVDPSAGGLSESPATGEAVHKRRHALRLIGVLTLILLALGGAWLVLDRFNASSACDQSGGTWRRLAGTCDLDPHGAVVRLLEKSKWCHDVPDSSLRECGYSAGHLDITIIGVGTSDASVSLDGVDENLGYGAGVLLAEGCVMVSPGTRLKEWEPRLRVEHAFVSTWTSEVYGSLTVCKYAGLEAKGRANLGRAEPLKRGLRLAQTKSAPASAVSRFARAPTGPARGHA